MKPSTRKLWLVSSGTVHVIVNAGSREFAKSYATPYLGADPDHYVVSPLTDEGDTVFLALSI